MLKYGLTSVITEEFGLKLNKKGFDIMLINTKVINTLKVENKEKTVFTDVYLILKKLRTSFSKNTVLFSPTTGEIIEMRELERIEGILSGFIETEDWEFK